MKAFSRTTIARVAAAITMVLVSGCSGIPQDGRYQSTGRGGGWENFRAEIATPARLT
jgi:hypothetical protein